MSGDHNMYASGSGDGQRSGWRKRTIMEMARESNMDVYSLGKDRDKFVSVLEAFAKLVREEATAEANARANESWTLMCEKMVAIEREAIYNIVVEAPFRQNLETEPNGEDLLFAVKVMAFDITSAIRARGQA